jgi:hypothetical protein
MIMWAIQIFLAVASGAAGTMKLVRCLATLMGGAAATHAMRGESAASFKDPRGVGDLPAFR